MIFDQIRKLIGGEPDGSQEEGGSLSVAEARRYVERYLKTNEEAGISFYCVLKNTEGGRAILALPRKDQAAVAMACVTGMADCDAKLRKFREAHPNPYQSPKWNELLFPRNQLFILLEGILKRKLPFTRAQVTKFAAWLAAEPSYLDNLYPISEFAAAVENLRAEEELGSELSAHISAIMEKLRLNQNDAGIRKAAQRLQQTLDSGPRMPIEPGEVWADAAIIAVKELPPESRAAWLELLELCVQATGAKPSAKWLKQAGGIIRERISAEAFRRMLVAWFPLVDKPVPEEIMEASRKSGAAVPFRYSAQQILDGNADILRGLVWASECTPAPEISRALTALALSSYKKVPGLGPRLIKVGNACIGTLGAMGGLDAIGQLAILKVRVKFGTAQAMLEKALTAAAEKEGLPREELEEMGVPAYGLTEVGRATVELGETTAELVIGEGRAVEILWKNAAGKALKSPPAAVRANHAEDLKELRQAQKDIERMLGAQADRLDGLFLAQKSWPLSIWRERYLDHPLVGVFARRLIWKFQTGTFPAVPALWNDGRLETVDGSPLEAGDGATVALWHPLDSRTEDVQAWRERIESLRIRQPFKQAHREIYVLTPAEENTGTYSNRFAAHVLKQHQFNALCGQRGWKNKLRLMVDDEYPPAHRKLSGWGLRAEFWIEGLGSDYGVDTNDAGSFLYLSTDQVRFYPIEAPGMTAHASGGGYGARWNTAPGESLPLRDIPPLVFSEIMRDVDLFVGVCSVGNDASWSDGGPGGRHRDYWTNYSFGELTGSAASRKEILERLVPRLKIASKCRFSDRFLIVQGVLHEYKIHLGSGNILMSPDDRYLCIVARQSVSKAGETVFLPFEGDSTLSLILSKAFLLADDTAIADQTIIQQIGKLPGKR